MPRPLSWLPRLHEMRRSVANSVRSHYGRKDLEQLFELQPRAAQKLLELLPSILLGTSRYVERATLAEFLEKVTKAEDVGAVVNDYQEMRKMRGRRALRTLVPRDWEAIDLKALPGSITLERGSLQIQFTNLEELLESLFALARVLTYDLESFSQAYEPVQESGRRSEVSETEELFAELEKMEQERTSGS